MVTDLITLHGFKVELPTVFKFHLQLAFQAEEDVTFSAPVVRALARRIIYHAHADVAELPRPPESETFFTLVHRRFNFRPFCGFKGNMFDLHGRVSSQVESAIQCTCKDTSRQAAGRSTLQPP